MLVKLKQQSAINPSPLNADNYIYDAYIVKSGIKTVSRPDGSNMLNFKLYSFESIFNVKFSIASTSTVKVVPTNANSGTITVTAEDLTIRTYTYIVEDISYVPALPELTAIIDNANVELFVSSRSSAKDIDGYLWNYGSINKKIGVDIDVANVDVVDGFARIFRGDQQSDFDTFEKRFLYNGVDSYLVVSRNGYGLDDYSHNVYYKLQENESYDEVAPIVNPTFLVWSNKICYFVGGIYVPVTAKSIENKLSLYTAVNTIDFCQQAELEYFEIVGNVEDLIDQDFNQDTANISWNTSSDYGFTEDELTNLDKTYCDRINNKLLEAFSIFDNALPVADTRPFTIKFVEWLENNSVDYIFNYCRFILTGELPLNALTLSSMKSYNDSIRTGFIIQFTPNMFNKFMNANDVEFFIRRLEYFNSVKELRENNADPEKIALSLNALEIFRQVKTKSASIVAASEFSSYAAWNMKQFAEVLADLKFFS